MTTEQTPSGTESPFDQLARVHSDYQKAVADLASYRAKAASALAFTQSALANQSLSEELCASQIAKGQTLELVYDARIKAREADLARLADELAAACTAAAGDFTRLIAAEVDKRTALVTQCVLAALDANPESLAVHQKLALDQYISALPEFAGSVREIAQLRHSSYLGSPGDGAYAASAASSLIKNFKIFKKLTSK